MKLRASKWPSANGQALGLAADEADRGALDSLRSLRPRLFEHVLALVEADHRAALPRASAKATIPVPVATSRTLLAGLRRERADQRATPARILAEAHQRPHAGRSARGGRGTARARAACAVRGCGFIQGGPPPLRASTWPPIGQHDQPSLIVDPRRLAVGRRASAPAARAEHPAPARPRAARAAGATSQRSSRVSSRARVGSISLGPAVQGSCPLAELGGQLGRITRRRSRRSRAPPIPAGAAPRRGSQPLCARPRGRRSAI